MFCKRCGAELQPDSHFCGKCGYNQNSPDSIPTSEADRRPSSYLVLSILVTLFCCIPLGIASIVYSSKVDPAYQAGDYQKALEYSNKAKSWALWGIFLSILLYLLYFILMVIGVLSEYSWFDLVDNSYFI